jgi:hypothetical protein
MTAQPTSTEIQMSNTASLFTQILSLFQRSDFARHVRELKAERHARGFSCWSQFVAMLFCQLAQARSGAFYHVPGKGVRTYIGLFLAGDLRIYASDSNQGLFSF